MSAPHDLRRIVEGDGELDVLSAILELATVSVANHVQVDMPTARRALCLELVGQLAREAQGDYIAAATCRAIVSWTADKLAEHEAPAPLMFSAPFAEIDSKPAPRRRRRTKRRTLAQRVRRAWRALTTK